MTKKCNRAFVLGAGFSKAAGMPLSTELTAKLVREARLGSRGEHGRYLRNLMRSIVKISGGPTGLNVEQLFDYAKLDAEMRKMAQQRCPVGRRYGCTPYNKAEMIEGLLRKLHDSLVRVILKEQKRAAIRRIQQFTRHLHPGDGIITFNYDTLVERCLDSHQVSWHHGLDDQKEDPYRVVVLKMHGSIDWIVAPRNQKMPKTFNLLFSKTDENARRGRQVPPEEIEYHCQLWRVPFDHVGPLDEMCHGLSTFELWQGVAGLGSFKPLHQLPGSGLTWARARGALSEAEEIYVIGFSMSPFDGMACLAFLEAIKRRTPRRRNPKRVCLIDPHADELAERYLGVFGPSLTLIKKGAQDVDWSTLLKE